VTRSQKLKRQVKFPYLFLRLKVVSTFWFVYFLNISHLAFLCIIYLSVCMVAGGAVHLLQAGRADVQDTANVSTVVSQSAHQSMLQHSVTVVIGRSISPCVVQMH